MNDKEHIFLPHVSFFKNTKFKDDDPRRIISGVVGEFGPALEIKQIKLIQFSDKVSSERKIIGNHKHYGDSGQWEIIVVLGDSNNPQFDFRYRNYNQAIAHKTLFCGDVVSIPPGCSLGLVSIDQSAMIIEISNQEYNSENYIKDDLFS